MTEVSSAREAATPGVPAAVTLRDLFDMHAAYVWNTLRRLGIAGADLEDVTHDVFLQVNAHLGEYDVARPVRPWLFGFAFRVASQYRRRAFRRRETWGEADASVHPGRSPDEQMVMDEDRRLVLLALEAIEVDRRAVFVLYEFDQEPMVEIARSLGIPVNTGYYRLRLARDDFRAAVHRLRARRSRL